MTDKLKVRIDVVSMFLEKELDALHAFTLPTKEARLDVIQRFMKSPQGLEYIAPVLMVAQELRTPEYVFLTGHPDKLNAVYVLQKDDTEKAVLVDALLPEDFIKNNLVRVEVVHPDYQEFLFRVEHLCFFSSDDRTQSHAGKDMLRMKKIFPVVTDAVLRELREKGDGYIVILYNGENAWELTSGDKCIYAATKDEARTLVPRTRKYVILSWFDVFGEMRVRVGKRLQVPTTLDAQGKPINNI